MRSVVLVVLVLAGVLLAVIGLLFVPVGLGEQGHADKMYEVGFKRPSDGCGGGRELYLDVEDGQALSCVPGLAVGGSGGLRMQGFTDAQNAEVGTLAGQLGIDGLTGGEQREIQRRVDRIVAEVPAADRRPYSATMYPAESGLWGTRRVWTGCGMVVVGVLGFVGMLRRFSR